MTALAAALGDGKLRHLTFLSLRANKIGPDGAKALAASTERGGCQKVAVLALNGNRIGDDGAVALAAAGRFEGGLPALTRLILDDNGVGDLGRCALADALRNYAFPNLVTLYALDAPPTDSEREGRGGTARLVRACAAREVALAGA